MNNGRILEKIGVFGWSDEDENLLLSSIITGDPLLIIGTHGSAKTMIAKNMSKLLNKKFVSYDASKSMFEDVLGFPNVNKLKDGEVEYIESPITIWDKDFILIDEINRAVPELQSKWLEIIRSRKIMGFDTDIKWVWAAMNPFSYSGTQEMDEALIGRFSLFLYSPELIEMKDEEIGIIAKELINDDDCVALKYWLNTKNEKIDSNGFYKEEDIELFNKMIDTSISLFMELKDKLVELPDFLSKFTQLVYSETDKRVKIDGRRLGFIYRSILSYLAIDKAKSLIYGTTPNDMSKVISTVIKTSLPFDIGLDNIKSSDICSIHNKIDNCILILEGFLNNKSDMYKINTVFNVFTSKDPLDVLNILLSNDLEDVIKLHGWNSFIKRFEDDKNMSIISLLINIISSVYNNILPSEALYSIVNKFKSNVDLGSIELDSEAVNDYSKIEENIINKYKDNVVEKFIVHLVLSMYCNTHNYEEMIEMIERFINFVYKHIDKEMFNV